MAGKRAIPCSEQIQQEIDRRKAERARVKALLWIVPKEVPDQLMQQEKPCKNEQK